MPTVYIPSRSGHDFSAAKKFGEICYLSGDHAVDPYKTNSIYCLFANILRNSTADDYILITGLSVMSAIATAIMARKHGKVNMLIYHASSGGYKARTISIDEMIGSIK